MIQVIFSVGSANRLLRSWFWDGREAVILLIRSWSVRLGTGAVFAKKGNEEDAGDVGADADGENTETCGGDEACGREEACCGTEACAEDG